MEKPTLVPPDSPLFVMGSVARDAPLGETQTRYPVVLLSHGTGGTAASLGWLAQGLAAAGFVVIGVDHHGNTASEPYRPEGFLCWWERPRDLSLALDRLCEEGPFAGRLDLDRVSSAGFSLGGYAVVSLLGAITDLSRFVDWVSGQADAQAGARGPREFPDLADHIEPLLRNSAVFRDSWERQSASNRDARVTAAMALAPAPPVRGFTPDSLRAIERPVTILVGEADREAPAEACSAWLQRQLPRSTLTLLGPAVGHYTLLCEGTAIGREAEPEIFGDPPGVERGSIHARVVGLALKALGSPRDSA